MRPPRRPRYPSDTTTADWALLERLLPIPACQTKAGGRPEKCFEVLVGAYSIAGRIEDDSDNAEVSELAESEFSQQMSDIAAIQRGDSWELVLQNSHDIASVYKRWFSGLRV
ncbi:hypothetical protein [Streptomyces sp. 3211]|uniref:hypothetical protein n=1 Tax=Streptomyces sp. 3211 TaxID=1964449 RepID=UPI0009A48155